MPASKKTKAAEHDELNESGYRLLAVLFAIGVAVCSTAIFFKGGL